MIQTVFKIQARPEKRKELLQTAQALKTATKREQGCIAYNVYQDPEDENAIVFVGEWKSKKDLRLHMSSDGFGAFVGEIALNTISKRESIEDFEAFKRG